MTRQTPIREDVTISWAATPGADQKGKGTRPNQGHEDAQGHGYDGVAWYHTRFKVPQRFAGRKLRLNFGGVCGSMNIWVNGQFAAFRAFKLPWWRNPYNQHFDVDLTDVVEGRPGPLDRHPRAQRIRMGRHLPAGVSVRAGRRARWLMGIRQGAVNELRNVPVPNA